MRRLSFLMPALFYAPPAFAAESSAGSVDDELLILISAAVLLLFVLPLLFKFNGWLERLARVAFTLVLASVSFILCAALHLEFFGKESSFFMASLLPSMMLALAILIWVNRKMEDTPDASGRSSALAEVGHEFYSLFYEQLRGGRFFVEICGSTMLLFIAAAQISKNFIVSPDWRYYGAWMTLAAGPCLAAAFVWLSRVKKSSRAIAFIVWTFILTFFIWKARVPGIGAAATSVYGIPGDETVWMHKRQAGGQKLELGEDKAVIYIRYAEALRLPLEGDITVSGKKSWFGFKAEKVVLPPSKQSE